MDLIIPNVGPWYLVGAGAILGWFKNFWTTLYEHTFGYLAKKISVTLTIEESEHHESYLWLNLWIENVLKDRRINSIRVKSRGGKYAFVPNYGTYYLWHGRNLLVVESIRNKDAQDTGSSIARYNQIITLTLWGTKDRQKMIGILDESREIENGLQFFTHVDEWWRAHKLSFRDLGTLYLPDAQLTEILNDVSTFFKSESKYRQLGIPWRRGWLLKGPPGTGKSSIVQVVASHFKLPVYYVNLSSVTAEILNKLFQSSQRRCIILIEDVDCIEAARERSTQDNRNLRIQTHELLNVLDGLIATEERIIIMTTNHPEKLDPALIRNGRVDRQFEITYSKDTELKKFFTKAREFYDLPSWETFRAELPAECTIANAQNLLFKYTSK